MKKVLLILILFVASYAAADTLTLNLLRLLDNYPQTEGGYWENTYTDGAIEDSVFRFSHTGSPDGGEGMSYWEGFTLCTSGDTTNYGAEGSSDGWILNQWGCMAGGGVDSAGRTVPGAPYMVAYWGFFAEQITPDYYSVRVDFKDNVYKPLGVWICNHPWPYYGNINGDGFASAFSKEGDYFALVAHGLDAEGHPVGTTVQLRLATYTGGKLVQSSEWQYMDLRALGTVSGIFFTMETSDTDALYGANTAVYFCLDRLAVCDADVQELSRPNNLRILSAGEDSLTLCWSPVENAEAYLLSIDSTEETITSDTIYTFRALQAYTAYTLSVAAVNSKDTSDIALIQAQTTDRTAPSVPEGLQVVQSNNSVTLTWNPSEDNVGIRRYTTYLDGEAYRRTASCTCTFAGLEKGKTYLLEVESEDMAGNKSARASIRITMGQSALEATISDDTEVTEVFAPNGMFMGNTIPCAHGAYIIKKRQKTNILIVQ